MIMSDAADDTAVRPEDVDALVNRIGNKTSLRVDALMQAGAHQVDYDRDHAMWLVGGEVVGGWAFRTYTELRKAGAIIVEEAPRDDSRSSIVELSAVGRALLDRWLD